MKNGNKNIPEYLKIGIAVVAVNYRLYPKVSTKVILLDDVPRNQLNEFNNIEKYGFKEINFFLSGCSAGGYVSSMLGLDKKYLKNMKLILAY